MENNCMYCMREHECKIKKVLPLVPVLGKCPKYKDLEEML